MQAFLGKYGWLGKGVSKLLQPTDVGQLKTMEAVVAYRPRGVLSGFLAILPTGAVFVPPGKPPQPVRMRLKETLPILLSAYLDGTDLVIEDVLVWQGIPVFQTMSFDKRWTLIEDLLEVWRPDAYIQECTIRLAQYRCLEELQEPEEGQVLEIVPFAPNTRRMVWIPTEESVQRKWIAKRERQIGPDIYSLWSLEGEKQPNIALVRTLAVSRLLTTQPDEVCVRSCWNKRFERWEIMGV